MIMGNFLSSCDPKEKDCKNNKSIEIENNSEEIEKVEDGRIGKKLAPFNPSHKEVIDIALHFLEPSPGAIIYDLGCGDGRFLVEAARRFDIKGIGIEYDQKYFSRAVENVKGAHLDAKVQIIHGNILDQEFTHAKLIFLYLVPEGIRMIRDKLIWCLRKNPSCRIVTYVFSIPDLIPVKSDVYKSTSIRLYTKDSLNPS
mmetsp:Transcript_15262/g.20143  ORF Transcript_15262/g.20143 Transcript_15262/m.20143 type:complete len:199 (+) Transcript_15262:44-640(+)